MSQLLNSIVPQMDTDVNTLDTNVCAFSGTMNTMVGNLVDLLVTHSEQTGVSYRQMSLKAGLSESLVALVVRGERHPGLEFCQGIAPVLGITVEQALRLAGHLPPLPPAVDNERRLLDAIRRLTDGERETIRQMLVGLVRGRASPQEAASVPEQAASASHNDTDELTDLFDAIWFSGEEGRRLLENAVRIVYDQVHRNTPAPKHGEKRVHTYNPG